MHEATVISRKRNLPSVVLARLLPQALTTLAKHPSVCSVYPSYQSKPFLDRSVSVLWHQSLKRTLKPRPGGSGVVIGIVDNGIDWAHPDFIDIHGRTRIRSLLIQDPDPPREYSEDDINAALERKRKAKKGGIPKEDLSIVPVPHGSHVAAIAAGNGRAKGGRYRGVAPKADLLVVRSDFESNSVIRGVQWIFQKAKELQRPAVVNLSLGTQLGPHDGTSPYDRALEHLSGPGRIIVAAAGNDGDTGIHAGKSLAPGSRWTAEFGLNNRRVETAIQIDIWIRSRAKLHVHCRTPFGGLIRPQSVRRTKKWRASLREHTGENGDQHLFFAIRFLRPPIDKDLGGWSLIFRSNRNAKARADCWIPDSSMGFFTSGNEARCLVSEPATSRGTIAVAAFATRSRWKSLEGLQQQPAIRIGNISDFSSPGPTRDNRKKPEIACPGQLVISALSSEIRSIPNKFRAYVEPGEKYCAMQGTSQAAPHATGAIALLLQKLPELPPHEVRNRLKQSCYSDRFIPPGKWHRRWGFGKLSLSKLL